MKLRKSDTIIVDGGKTFEGTARQFDDCFAVDATMGDVRQWAADLGSTVEIHCPRKGGLQKFKFFPPMKKASEDNIQKYRDMAVEWFDGNQNAHGMFGDARCCAVAAVREYIANQNGETCYENH